MCISAAFIDSLRILWYIPFVKGYDEDNGKPQAAQRGTHLVRAFCDPWVLHTTSELSPEMVDRVRPLKRQ